MNDDTLAERILEQTTDALIYADREGVRSSAIRAFPVSRSNSVCTRNSTGAGCAQSSPRISTPMTL